MLASFRDMLLAVVGIHGACLLWSHGALFLAESFVLFPALFSSFHRFVGVFQLCFIRSIAHQSIFGVLWFLAAVPQLILAAVIVFFRRLSFLSVISAASRQLSHHLLRIALDHGIFELILSPSLLLGRIPSSSRVHHWFICKMGVQMCKHYLEGAYQKFYFRLANVFCRLYFFSTHFPHMLKVGSWLVLFGQFQSNFNINQKLGDNFLSFSKKTKS